MLREQMAVVELMWDMINKKTGEISKVDFAPQKPAFHRDEEICQPFPRALPESQGVSSESLAEMIRELADLKEADIHQVMVLRKGYVIAECGFAPYPRGMWHITHSLCKSVIGMAIGLMMGEGKLGLDDKVVEIFKSRTGLFGSLRLKDITVRHLLTMTSGINFNECGAVAGNDWVKGFLDSSTHDTPGTVFDYNSMNSYLLSAIVKEITGEPLMDYLRPRLWEPLGIRQVFWESCPQGNSKGGWGLFLRPEDAAKLGQLYLQKGMWKGQQVIPQEWVEESVKPQVDTPDDLESDGYGFQLWIGDRPGSFNFNGMLGQNVVVYPDLEMVIVTNAGSNELFQKGAVLDVVKRHFGVGYELPQGSLPLNPAGVRCLHKAQQEAERGRDYQPMIVRGGWKKRKMPKGSRNFKENRKKMLDGKVYELEEQHVGIFPLMMQVFHNNFTDGISSIGFTVQEQQLWMQVTEGECTHSIAIGFGAAAVTEIVEHGEPYLVGTMGKFTTDENDMPVLALDIAFLEDAARRKMNLHFSRDYKAVEIHWNETPGKHVILSGLRSITTDMSGVPILSVVKEKGGMELLQIAAEHTIQPVVKGDIPIKGEHFMNTEELMALTEAAGFEQTAVISTDLLEFHPEYRVYCEMNLCGNFNRNYACPPYCGTPEEMEAKALAYRLAIVFQSITYVNNAMDNDETKKVKKEHRAKTMKAIRTLKEHGVEGMAIMPGPCSLCSACGQIGDTPCPHPDQVASCLSAYGIEASKMAEDCGMTYYFGDDTVALFSMYLIDRKAD